MGRYVFLQVGNGGSIIKTKVWEFKWGYLMESSTLFENSFCPVKSFFIFEKLSVGSPCRQRRSFHVGQAVTSLTHYEPRLRGVDLGSRLAISAFASAMVGFHS